MFNRIKICLLGNLLIFFQRINMAERILKGKLIAICHSYFRLFRADFGLAVDLVVLRVKILVEYGFNSLLLGRHYLKHLFLISLVLSQWDILLYGKTRQAIYWQIH